MIVPILLLTALTVTLGIVNRGQTSSITRDYDLATLPFDDRVAAYDVLESGSREDRRAMRDRLRTLGYDTAARHF